LILRNKNNGLLVYQIDIFHLRKYFQSNLAEQKMQGLSPNQNSTSTMNLKVTSSVNKVKIQEDQVIPVSNKFPKETPERNRPHGNSSTLESNRPNQSKTPKFMRHTT
jgi:hypothetical protein